MGYFTPKQIVEALDKYIIGQHKARGQLPLPCAQGGADSS